MPKCAACGAAITFVKTINGQNMPVDAKKIKVFFEMSTPGVGIPFDHYGQIEAYMPHWATCSDPDRFRRKK